jgi:hypothetical protein
MLATYWVDIPGLSSDVVSVARAALTTVLAVVRHHLQAPEARLLDSASPAEPLMMADQHQHEHDHHRAKDHAHDDHPGVGQASQVQPLCSRFGALFLFALGLTRLRRRPRRRRYAQQRPSSPERPKNRRHPPVP